MRIDFPRDPQDVPAVSCCPVCGYEIYPTEPALETMGRLYHFQCVPDDLKEECGAARPAGDW